MDQRDPRIDPNRVTGERMAADRMPDERTVSIGAVAAILAAALIVLVAGLSFLAPADRTAQVTDLPSVNLPSSSDRVTTPPAGTTGIAPRPAPAPSTPR